MIATLNIKKRTKHYDSINLHCPPCSTKVIVQPKAITIAGKGHIFTHTEAYC